MLGVVLKQHMFVLNVDKKGGTRWTQYVVAEANWWKHSCIFFISTFCLEVIVFSGTFCVMWKVGGEQKTFPAVSMYWWYSQIGRSSWLNTEQCKILGADKVASVKLSCSCCAEYLGYLYP